MHWIHFDSLFINKAFERVILYGKQRYKHLFRFCLLCHLKLYGSHAEKVGVFGWSSNLQDIYRAFYNSALELISLFCALKTILAFRFLSNFNFFCKRSIYFCTYCAFRKKQAYSVGLLLLEEASGFLASLFLKNLARSMKIMMTNANTKKKTSLNIGLSYSLFLPLYFYRLWPSYFDSPFLRASNYYLYSLYFCFLAFYFSFASSCNLQSESFFLLRYSFYGSYYASFD